MGILFWQHIHVRQDATGPRFLTVGRMELCYYTFHCEQGHVDVTVHEVSPSLAVTNVAYITVQDITDFEYRFFLVARSTKKC